MTIFSGRDLACVRSEREVFLGLSFELAAGEALTIVGPNGSGKSSLLRLLCGLLPPASGRILWEGRPISEDREAHRERLHYAGHAEALKPLLTVAENLCFAAALAGPIEAAAVTRALEAFGLARLADFPCLILSAGQRRRVALARLLIRRAPLWLLDEPVTGLDAASLVALRNLIEDHRAGGGMVVMSTHVDLGLDGAKTLDVGDFSTLARRRSAA